MAAAAPFVFYCEFACNPRHIPFGSAQGRLSPRWRGRADFGMTHSYFRDSVGRNGEQIPRVRSERQDLWGERAAGDPFSLSFSSWLLALGAVQDFGVPCHLDGFQLPLVGLLGIVFEVGER